nr:hypothetical protein [Candidatus Cloacimonadota bacterium]
MKIKHYQLLFWGWMVLIWILSSIPGSGIPDLNKLGADKFAHFGIYFMWGVWASLYFLKRGTKTGHTVVIVVIMLLLAALDEYHQHFIPGRQVYFGDLLANWAGLSIAYLGYRLYLRRRRELQ